MLLIVAAFGLLAIYWVVDVLGEERQAKTVYYLKLGLVYGLIILLVFGKTILLINLRHLSGPASYAHDGGVIQTEATIDYFLSGRNPYVEDYTKTPMAEWGFNEYRTALYHYPYLPWTFVFSAPFYLLSRTLLGWFDERMVYLLLFALTLALVHRLVWPPREKVMALALVGLNPLLGLSLIFGENDPFVLFWLVLGLWWVRAGPDLPGQRRLLLGAAAFGLACASKPTAWFLAPFWLLYLLSDRWNAGQWPSRTDWRALLITLWQRAWTLPVVFGLLTLPWFLWNPDAMIDDIWRWSAGQGPTGYQIWGWGASNLVLAFGGVANRFEYWPFIIPQLLIAGPLLWFLLRQQARQNTMNRMLYGYVVLLLLFFYLSRFLQPNYLGYLAAVLTLAFMVEERRGSEI
jgi:hypothetical protein